MTRRILDHSLFALLGITATLATSCVALKGTGLDTAFAQALVSDEQESQIGLRLKGELEKKPEFRYVEDPEITKYVEGLADKVIQLALRDRPGVTWKVAVVDDPRTVNAFATPGGYLYVNSGLLLAVENEAELAAVMGHEAGHVVGRHAARQMVQTNGMQAVINVGLGQNQDLLTQLAGNVASTGAIMVYGRSQEDESDEYGARYAAGAGFDPKGLNTFLDKQAKVGQAAPEQRVWVSSHPVTTDRIAHIDSYIAQKHLSGTELGKERLEAIKQRVAAYKAPPRSAGSGGSSTGGQSQ